MMGLTERGKICRNHKEFTILFNMSHAFLLILDVNINIGEIQLRSIVERKLSILTEMKWKKKKYKSMIISD